MQQMHERVPALKSIDKKAHVGTVVDTLQQDIN
jgi:hypothetical protein